MALVCGWKGSGRLIRDAEQLNPWADLKLRMLLGEWRNSQIWCMADLNQAAIC
jgi:hypothetical protein